MILKNFFYSILIFYFAFSNTVEFDYQNKSFSLIDNHFIIDNANASKKIDNYTFDYFRLEFVLENEHLDFKITNIEWIDTDIKINSINFDTIFKESNLFDYKSCPTIFFDIFPYKINNQNKLSFIKSITISFDINNVVLENYCQPEENVINKQFIETKKYSRTDRDYDYLVLTKIEFLDVANKLKDIHQDLDIDIIDINQITDVNNSSQIEYQIRDYLLNRINNDLSLKYLLILGDETIVPPIYTGSIPSDDYFTSPGVLSGNPQLSTGRIPVDNVLDAEKYLIKLENYLESIINNSNISDAWRMTVSLLSDDENNPNPNKYPELSHTQNSNIIYNQISRNLIVNPLYGIDYVPQQDSDGLIHTQFTDEIILNINNGLSLINYIGHGNHNTLADEKIIQMERDLNLIDIQQNKLPIWVVGTCSFGEYDGKDSMSEELIKNENAAISVISTTRGIGEISNINYLTKFFEKVNDFIENETNNDRLGDLVRKSKNNSSSEYLFHLFGDPAMPLPFPKLKVDSIDTFPNDLIIGMQSFVDFNGLNGFIEIYDAEKNISKSYSTGDSINYTVPGNTVYRGSFDQNLCFTTSIDASICDACAKAYMYIIDNNYNLSKNISDINIISNDNVSQDVIGPQINFYSDDLIEIFDEDNIYTGSKITVKVNDTSGINLMGGLGHNIRYWFNDEDNYQIIEPELFQYISNCNEVSEGKFFIDIPNLPLGNNILFVEIWDNLNNKTLSNLSFNLKSFEPELYDVYNFPNPFDEDTFFTFRTSVYPVSVYIKIFDFNGNKIKSLSEDCISSFCSVYWNGRNNQNKFIKNGTYIYSIEINNNNYNYKNLYKLTKIK